MSQSRVATSRSVSSPTAVRRGPIATSDRFRQSFWSILQAQRIKLWLTLLGQGVFRFNIEVEGLENVPPDEPVIVAAAPHRSWIDPFVILTILPPLPRTYFLAAIGTTGDRRWKRVAMRLAGGMVPVETRGALNRDGLELALAILRQGNRVGIFPEGWGDKPDAEVMPLKRGVAFISEHSGRRVLPVALAGASELWRGKTLRVRIAPPLAALPPGADRNEEQAFVDHLRAVLLEATPPEPLPAADGKKPWRWLTKML